MYVSGFSCLLSSEKDGKIVSVSKSNNPKVDRKGELKYPHQGAKSKTWVIVRSYQMESLNSQYSIPDF